MQQILNIHIAAEAEANSSDDSDDVVQVADAVAVAPFVDAVDDFKSDGGIDEVGRTDLDGSGAAHEKLDGVVGIHNPPQTDDGDTHGFGHLVHHAQSDGLDARAGKSARSDAQPGASTLDVDAHAHEGVDERNAVGALSFDSASNFGDVGDIGGKFDNQGLRIAARTALTTEAAPAHVTPKAMPPSCTLGQEILSSMAGMRSNAATFSEHAA